MWQILHRLFGWDYVHLENTATEIVRRVRATKSGERYVCYFSQYMVFIDRADCTWRVTELTAARTAEVVSITDITRRA